MLTRIEPSGFWDPGDEPVPHAHAVPLTRWIDALDGGNVAFLLKAANQEACAWLKRDRIELHLRSVMLDACETEVWPLLEDTWAISMTVSGGIELPENAMHVHLVSQRLAKELAFDFNGGSTPSFSVYPVAGMRTAEAVQENIREMNALLEIIVNNQLTTQFQPIATLSDGKIYGYEALIRGPHHTPLRRPGALFHAAAKAQMIAWFDMACLEQCFQQAANLGLKHHLFVNVEAEGLDSINKHDRPLASRVRDAGLRPDQVVIEITERQTLDDFPRLTEAITSLREQGFKLAVDDVGAGYNSLQLITELQPDFVKIDRNLVKHLDVNGARRGLLATLVRYSRQIGTAVIGEGAETWDELATLIDLDVTYGQGYLLGKPADVFCGVRKDLRQEISARHAQRSQLTMGRGVKVSGLMRKGCTLAVEAPLAEAARRFARDASLTSIVIIENEAVRGLLMRQALDHILNMANTARALKMLPDEEVGGWMSTDFITASPETELGEMMRMAARRQSISLDNDIVICEVGQKYLGVLPVRTLMESLSTAHQFGSRYSDSLSGLPNRVVLEHTIKERLENKQPTGLLRVDVMYLEAYNRRFGTAHGDELIRGLVDILQEVAPAREGHVLTHLGGDDFVVVTDPDNVENLSNEVRTRFSALAPRLFPFETSQEGYMEIEEHGRVNRVPLCSLAIAGLTGRSTRLTSVTQALQTLDMILHSVQASGTGGCSIDTVQPRKAA